MTQEKPGKGWWGWLGRQIGHVAKAIKTDVQQQIIHREQRVEEAKLPNRPELTLRRTVIDEVIVDKTPAAKKQDPAAGDTAPSQNGP